MSGQDIKTMRAKLSMTQQALADALGVDRITVLRWENNQKKPSNLAKRQIARLIGKEKG